MDIHVVHALLLDGQVSTRVCLLRHVRSPGDFIQSRAFTIFISERLRGDSLQVRCQVVVIDIFREPYQRGISILDRVYISQFSDIAWGR